jgi:hypothetical protein
MRRRENFTGRATLCGAASKHTVIALFWAEGAWIWNLPVLDHFSARKTRSAATEGLSLHA